MSNQIPPSSPEIEKAFLASLLIGSSYIHEAAGTITPEMFYMPENADIMKAIAAVHTAGNPVDIMTVTNELRKAGKPSSIGATIAELSSTVTSDYNADSYARIIIEKFSLRQAIKESMDLQQLAYDEDFDGVITSASSLGDKLLNNLPSIAAASIDQILKEGLADMDRRAASKDKDIYVEAGIRAIDRLIGGFDAGSLIIIGGVTSMGKTAFALQLAYNMSIFHPVMFFSLEMTKVEIMNRYIVAQTDIDPVRIKRPEMLTPQEWQLIEKANGEIRTHNLTVEDSTRLTIYNLRAKIYRVVRSKGMKAVFIDYLQLMGGKKGADMAEYYGSISRTCKEIAKELKIRIFLLSQLNREAAKRDDKIPRLHDLRSSGEIEQDADIVIFPVRCDRAGIDDPQHGLGPGKAIISIPKNRNGETDNVVIDVSKNAARWWDTSNEFYGPTTPVSPHYLDDKEEAKF